MKQYSTGIFKATIRYSIGTVYRNPTHAVFISFLTTFFYKINQMSIKDWNISLLKREVGV